MTGIGIVAVDPVSRDFAGTAADEYGHGTVFDAGVHGALKDILDLFRTRRSRNVPVVRFPVQDRVAYTAAHDIGFMSVRVQSVQYQFYGRRQFDLHVPMIPFFTVFCKPDRDFS